MQRGTSEQNYIGNEMQEETIDNEAREMGAKQREKKQMRKTRSHLLGRGTLSPYLLICRDNWLDCSLPMAAERGVVAIMRHG